MTLKDFTIVNVGLGDGELEGECYLYKKDIHYWIAIKNEDEKFKVCLLQKWFSGNCEGMITIKRSYFNCLKLALICANRWKINEGGNDGN